MIIDCIMASYEDEVIQLRDLELKDVVDRRLIVVGDTDFRGSEALPFTYDSATSHTDTAVFRVKLPQDGTPWDREFALRDASLTMARALHPEPDTLFMVSDADEIPHPLAIEAAAKHNRPTLLRTDYRQWWMDWRAPDRWQLDRQPVIAQAHHYDFFGGASNARISATWPVSVQVGWHLSTLGDAGLAQRKLSTFAHEEYDTSEFNDRDTLEKRRENAQDILGRFDLQPVTHLPSVAVLFSHLLGPQVG